MHHVAVDAKRHSSGYGKAFIYAVVLHLCLVLPFIAANLSPTKRGASIGEAISAMPVEEAEAGDSDPVDPARRPTETMPPPRSLASYTAAAKRKLGRAWRGRELGIAKGLSCRVRLTVRGDGSVIGVRMVRGSGSAAFDRSVIEAVRNASPLPPPPSAEMRNGVYEFDLVVDPAA